MSSSWCNKMKRREVLAFLAGAAALRPISALVQPGERVRTIGLLIGLSEADLDHQPRMAAFESGLQELGWTEGRNVRTHYRYSAETDQLEAYAMELVALQPDVIVAGNRLAASLLLKETGTIPIVFATSPDPVADGFVRSLARPGGNATGFTDNLATIGGKWLELLKELAPNIRRVAVMFNPDTTSVGSSYYLPPLEAAAASLGVTSVTAPVRNTAEIERNVAALGGEPGCGLIVMPDNFTSLHRRLIVASTAQNRVPAIYPYRYFAAQGGLMSYGVSLSGLYRRIPTLIDRILRGTPPADIPVQPLEKVDLTINLKTARALGLNVPRIMLARANEVIE
jgi:putative tryptophan/tyrosine transport system substrate-binding protein